MPAPVLPLDSLHAHREAPISRRVKVCPSSNGRCRWVLWRVPSAAATASALWDYDAEGSPLPEAGEMSILLNGHGHPVALVATTKVEVVPFDEVSGEHARREREATAPWRIGGPHTRGPFSEHSLQQHKFSERMPVVLETFEVIYVAGSGAPPERSPST